MPADQSADGADHDGFRVDVDWLLSGVIQVSAGLAAAVLFGQYWPEWSFTFFFWGILAVRIGRHSVSLEFDERGREQLAFSWPWR